MTGQVKNHPKTCKGQCENKPLTPHEKTIKKPLNGHCELISWPYCPCDYLFILVWCYCGSFVMSGRSQTTIVVNFSILRLPGPAHPAICT
jgi:hypothetical protein